MATEETVVGENNTEATTATEVTNEVQTKEATPDSTDAPTDVQSEEAESEEPTAENQPPDVDYNFTLPDGYTADEDLTADLKSFAKENNLNAEQAQKIADMGVQMQAKQSADYQKQVDAWKEQVKTDEVVGGENFEANVSFAKKALNAYGDQELNDLLVSTGFGNHPAIVRAFYKMGKSVSEDTLVVANGTNTDAKDTASVMFPNMT
tara:strand:- start:5584 stop:6204 length:621 start_codon:yes stop_codon:yes gene_type:complete